jgi:hypothetical protein
LQFFLASDIWATRLAPSKYGEVHSLEYKDILKVFFGSHFTVTLQLIIALEHKL